MVYSQSKLYDQFELFLKSYRTPDGKFKYREQISRLASEQKRSILINYQDVIKFDPELAISIVESPSQALEECTKAAIETIKVENYDYSQLIEREFKVRINGLPERLNLRNITSKYIDKLICVGGMVVRTSEIMPLLKVAAFVCPNGHVTHIIQNGTTLKTPSKCSQCNEVRNFELDRTRSIFTDFQILRIQELPEELPPGQLPQYIDIEIDGDIVNLARPGDRVIVTGIIRAEGEIKKKMQSSLFKIKLEGLYLEELSRSNERIEITRDDEEKIKELAKSPEIYEQLIASLAPGIYGYNEIKEALLLMAVGSPQVFLPDGQVLRGDINVLLVGDPGTAKSELLKYVSRLAPRALYTSGRGSTAAGLTAAVVKEANGMMMLEAGAVVLADQGIACMTPDNEIYTGESLLNLDQLWEKSWPQSISFDGIEVRILNSFIQAYDQTSKADVRARAVKIIKKPYSGKIVKITLSSGLELKVTPDHLIRNKNNCKNVWTEAGKLKINDLIRCPVKLFGPQLKLNLSPEKSYSLGRLYANGHPKFNVKSTYIMQAINNFANTDKNESTLVALLNANRNENKEEELEIPSIQLMPLKSNPNGVYTLAQQILEPKIDKILMMDDTSLAAFFAGLFDYNGDSNYIRKEINLFLTNDKHELSVLLHALRRFSIHGKICKKTKSMSAIKVTGKHADAFLEIIRPYSCKAQKCEIRPKAVREKNIVQAGLERIKKIEMLDYDGYVYDLTVPQQNNFSDSLVYIHNCIDEFDKMKPEDRSVLHEVMEQQTVSVAKGGIVATLNARTSIVAAANPLLGKYDTYKNLYENINLPVPLLNRFDLIFIIRDLPNREADEKLAEHILEIRKKRDYVHYPPIEFNLLRKYLEYAKRISPKLSEEASAKIKAFYLEMRGSSQEGTIAITARQLETLVRLTLARARLLLKENADAEDATRALELVKSMLETVGVDVRTKKFDLGGILQGKPASERSQLQIALETFAKLCGPKNEPVEEKVIIDELIKTGKFTNEDAVRIITIMLRNGQIYEKAWGKYSLV